MNQNRLPLYAMPLIVFGAALLQSTVATRLAIRGVKPDMVLIIVVIGTLIYGGRAGLVWAFLGGIGLDLFSGGPLGISSLGLLLAALVAGVGHRILSRYHILVPIGASGLGTLLYGCVYVGLLSLLHEAGQMPLFQGLGLPNYQLAFWAMLQDVIIPATIYNMTIVLFLTPLLNRVPEIQEVV
ncbi:MAG: rod shape-determining protein MreD [Caldilineaceae bacterium]|nr:rod shape-determining protein MreD [Caldilineaceae bacterium]